MKLSEAIIYTSAPFVLLFTAAMQVHAQDRVVGNGVIVGRTSDAEDGRPIANVSIRLVEAGKRTTSGDNGRFSFDSVPPGEHSLEVRHLGYEAREQAILVPTEEALSLKIQLFRQPVGVEPLTVSVQSELQIKNLQERGFYRRRERNFGYFFGPQYLTAWRGMRLGLLIERAPGIRVRRIHPTGRYAINNLRCPLSRGMPVYVDGHRWGGGVLSMPAVGIAAVEVYKGPSQMAGVPYGAGTCGAILVWTWRGPNPFIGLNGDLAGCPENLRKLRRNAC